MIRWTLWEINLDLLLAIVSDDETTIFFTKWMPVSQIGTVELLKVLQDGYRKNRNRTRLNEIGTAECLSEQKRKNC